MAGGIFFMLLLKASHIKKYFGERLLFDLEELSIYTGDKIGIVGANGVGKTTLFNILTGEVMAEEGEINRYGTLSYYRQFDLVKDAHGSKDYDQKLLKELQVADKRQQKVISGGEETRLKLAGTFGRSGHIHLFDEPTANLDLKGISLLQEKLNKLETVLLISHDRALLNNVCTEILEISQGKIKIYPGNYNEYERLKKEEIEKEWKDYEAYREEKKRLEGVYQDKKRLAEAAVKIPKGMSPREAHLRDFLCVTGRNHDGKQKNLNRVAESVKKRIEHMEVKEKPKEEPRIHMDFRKTNPPENSILIEGKGIDFSYGSNKIFESASFQIPNHKKIAIIGPNGIGKTTLLKLIQEADNTRDIKGTIRIVPKAVLGFLHQNLGHLEEDKSVLENVMRESVQNEEIVRNILAGFLFKAKDISKKAEVLSGGERMKLALAKILVSGANVLILDEPTNFLDMPSMITLQERMKEYEGTILFVSHDREFINNTADTLLALENRKLHLFEGNLKDYEIELLGRSMKLQSENDGEKLRLELRKTQLLVELSSKRRIRSKDEVEEEYQSVLEKLKQMIT
jgi:macrolide transport system ATP-binding/permease protein